MAATPASDSVPSVKAIQEVRIISIRSTVENYRAQSALWTKLTAFCTHHSIAIAGACFTMYYDKDFKPKDVDLEVCLPIAADVALPTSDANASGGAGWGDISVRTLPAVERAAAITHIGSYNGLPSAYNTFYRWIGENHLEPTDCVREVYLVMDTADASESSTPNRDSSSRKWAKHCGCTGPCRAELFSSDDSDCDNLDEDELKRVMRRQPHDSDSNNNAGSCHTRSGVLTGTDMVIFSCDGDKTIHENASELPQQAVIPIIGFLPAYFMIGFGHGVGMYLKMQLILILLHSASIAPIVGTIIMLPFLLFDGLLVNTESIPASFSWLAYCLRKLRTDGRHGRQDATRDCGYFSRCHAISTTAPASFSAAQVTPSTPGPAGAGSTTPPATTPPAQTRPPPPPAQTRPPPPPAQTRPPPPPSTPSPPPSVTQPPAPPVTQPPPPRVTQPPPPPPVTTAPPPPPPPATTSPPPPPATTAPPTQAPTKKPPPPPPTASPKPAGAPAATTVAPPPSPSPVMTPAAVVTPVTPVPPSAQPKAMGAVGVNAGPGKVSAAPVLETSSAIFPNSGTPGPAVGAGMTSAAGGSNSGTVTIALIVAGTVATVLVAAVVVYAKTARRHDEIKRGRDSSHPPRSTGRASSHEPYEQLSPRPPEYDAYVGAGGAAAVVGAFANAGPPIAAPSKARARSDVSPRANRVSSDGINLNDPAFDVLTPLSDIATVGGGLLESFDGYSSKGTSEINTSSSRSIFYATNQTLPSPENDVAGSDSDSDSDSDKSNVDDDDDVAVLSFDSELDSSARGWESEGNLSRDESARSAAFSIGSEERESSVGDMDSQRSLLLHQQPARHRSRSSAASTGLHDRDASVSSYSGYVALNSGRSSDTSDLNEYDASELERFDSNVFSDGGAGDADELHDDESYREDSYAAPAPANAASARDSGGFHSFSSSSSDGDDIDGGYHYDDSSRGSNALSFSSTSSFEV
ncbi:hypothetical protein PybrP1_003725 [[Pythium] brassicae (nom. inval.)]|nr:hypothetical protein PybrP1_003725 [[Pythium] brassicae (nom. inval.)]